MNGVIAWFARNGVAANLLMLTLLALGIRSAFFVMPVEGFPEFDLDEINVSVSYRGATPEETEEGVVLKIEEAIKDLEGIQEIESRASEGRGTVRIEVESGYEPREVLDDVKNRIDAINTFPDETEKPVIRLAQRIPIRIRLEPPPNAVQLRIGATASILVMTGNSDNSRDAAVPPTPRALQ